MSLRIVQLGTPRYPNEGIRIGTVRRPPRGVAKKDFAKRDFYDVWFPVLAPSDALLKDHFPITDSGSWRTFKRKFLAEMKQPDKKRSLELIAALSHTTALSVGCYCADEQSCHRSLLRELFTALEADIIT